LIHTGIIVYVGRRPLDDTHTLGHQANFHSRVS
jgi:hypothetical protein